MSCSARTRKILSSFHKNSLSWFNFSKRLQHVQCCHQRINASANHLKVYKILVFIDKFPWQYPSGDIRLYAAALKMKRVSNWEPLPADYMITTEAIFTNCLLLSLEIQYLITRSKDLILWCRIWYTKQKAFLKTY